MMYYSKDREKNMSLQVNDRLFWPGGKKKSLTLSYDDGIEQDRRLISLLDQHRVKCTFNLNSGLLGVTGTVAAGKKEVSHNKIGELQIATLYKGHEIAAHGQYHESMFGMDTARCVEEILSCRKGLEKITGKPLTGYAYSFGVCDHTIISAMKTCGISYARTIEATHKFEIPLDFLRWDPTCHHDDKNIMKLADEFLSDEFSFSLYSPAKLFYVWGHSYEFDQNENWGHMEAFISKVSGKENVWYATNGEIYEYVKAYQRLLFSVDSSKVYNPTCTSVWLGGIFTNDSVEVKPGCVTELIPPIKM